MIAIGNVVNLAACLALGLGYWGFPRLGVQGIALATVFSRYAMLVAAVVFTVRELRPANWRLPGFDRRVQRNLFKLGLPAAGHTGLEVGAFTLATFVAGLLGATALAAHHVSLMMAAFTFMFPLGFSAAAAVRVGMFVGAGDPRRARLAGWLCIATSAVVMLCFAGIYLAFPRWLMRLFTEDPAVIKMGVKILMVVALFQVADGIQVSTAGALRGIGNTRAAMFANLIGHYPVGLVLGLLLCFPLGLGVTGLWCGLAGGLATVACLVVRAWLVRTRDLSKLRPLSSGTEVIRGGAEPSRGS
jgi:MATE family multidrug resistance protein